MLVRDITEFLEKFAPPGLQETYDNAGLLVGNPNTECSGVLTCLDVTEAIVEEAVKKNCNLIVAHHPVIFQSLKKLSGSSWVERAIILAIKNDISIFAIHTNLDNTINGVNHRIAEKLGLHYTRILSPKPGMLKKLVTFCPEKSAEEVRNALFNTGGRLGKYSECSFNQIGTGTFKPGEGAAPFVGKKGKRHLETEVRIELIFPATAEKQIVKDLSKAHPYEEVAYDIYDLSNTSFDTGSGMIGHLPKALKEPEFLNLVQSAFKIAAIRHSPFTRKKIAKVALCGGAGSFLLKDAIRHGADAFITGDIKYHDFFDADGQLLFADIGHFESEQYTIELLYDILKGNFPNFAVLKTEVNTNPVQYFI